MFGFDVAPTIAAIAGLTSAALAALTWAGAQRTKRSARDVDAIRVTQDALAGTVQLQHEDNERLRTRLLRVERDLATCRRRFERLVRQCEDAGIVADEEEWRNGS